MSIPRIVISTGEPAGIGPELLVKLAQTQHAAQLIALSDPTLLQNTAQQLGLPLRLVTMNYNDERRCALAGELFIDAIHLAVPATPGVLDVRNAGFVLQQLHTAVQRVQHRHADAIVTNPLQKSLINDSGVRFTGHTEFLSEQAGNAPVQMLLANDALRVALATTHLPLTKVSNAITPALLEQQIRLLDRGLREQLGITHPRIAVLGLNPHAGESGHLGDEEIRIITPVIERLRAEGLLLTGPLSADTAFTPDKRAQYDAYLAMYHDQGLPVLKALGFHRSVNITLGLPFIRTSVDHGTALDLAGKNQADAQSLLYAVETALQMIKVKQH